MHRQKVVGGAAVEKWGKLNKEDLESMIDNAVSLKTQHGSSSGKQNTPHGDLLEPSCMEAVTNKREAVGHTLEEYMLTP